MHSPLVTGRLRSACVLLGVVDEHAEAIAAWFAQADDAERPLTAPEAAENVRELMQGYAEVLVARSRILAALDQLAGDPDAATWAADQTLRQALAAIRVELSGDVGMLAIEKADLERPLPRRSAALLGRARGSADALDGFFSTWGPHHAGGWPDPQLAALKVACDALEAALVERAPPGPTSLARAAALDAFDEAFEDTSELVHAMLQLADRPDAARAVTAGWDSPGLVTDPEARAAVPAETLARLLGEAGAAPWVVLTPPSQPRPS